MELHRYTKKPIPSIIWSVSLGLLIFNSPNTDYYKLVSMDKPELITEVVTDRSSLNRVFQYL